MCRLTSRPLSWGRWLVPRGPGKVGHHTPRLGLVFAVTLAFALLLVQAAPSATAKRPKPLTEPRAGAVALTAAPPQTVDLRLPFQGIWGVIQGFDSGDTHVGYAAFALDFVPAEKLTPTTQQRRGHLTDFPCFGQPVLAPADGRVVKAPSIHHGRPHAPSEYTEFRHLQSGSVAVAAGQRVRRGQLIGRCGNSGNSNTPHVHIGLLGSADPITTRPMTFSHYQVLATDGKWRVGAGVPRSQEILRPTP